MASASAQQNSLVDRNAGADTASESILLERYLPFVRSRVYAFRQKSIETEDLFQEGLIGLLYAIRAYNLDMGASFETFAYICITNRLRTAVAKADKMPEAVSLESCDIQDKHLVSRVSKEDPQEIFISREQINLWLAKADNCLSDLEKQVIRLYLSGYSYQEIAQTLFSTTKAVDNALQRARRKLRRF